MFSADALARGKPRTPENRRRGMTSNKEYEPENYACPVADSGTGAARLSTKRIADITGKEHRHVLRDVREQCQKLGITPFIATVQNCAVESKGVAVEQFAVSFSSAHTPEWHAGRTPRCAEAGVLLIRSQQS